MKAREVFEVYRKNILPTYTKTPLIFVKGKASSLWDINNKKYLDFFPGWGACNLGHCHAKVMQAVRDQVSKLIFIPNNYHHLAQAQLARELVFLSFPSKVFFCNSGAEANEAAIKFSRKFGAGRYEIITFNNSFHGRTLAALAATAQKKYQQGFDPLPEGFKAVPFSDIAALRRQLSPKTAAVMIELIQGEGGINVAPKDFVFQLRALCDENKLLLIIDEVQTGIGRTGTMFCYQQYGIEPDILTLAKSLGGGLPIGCMLVKKDIADTLGPGSHASTFGGGPLVAKSALAVLKAIQKEKLLKSAKQMGEYIFSRLDRLKAKYPVIKEVRGMGLMVGMELLVEAKPVVDEALKNGLLINCTQGKVLRLMPALSVSKKEVDKAIGIIEAIISRL